MNRKLLRADATRNRSAIIDSARECFARSGVNAQMDEIARGANVGIGTLYRHFPSKAELVSALLTERVERLLELADAQGASAAERFGNVVTEIVRLQSCDRSISDLGYCADTELQHVIVPLMDTMRGVLARLMSDAVASHDLRDDVTVDNVLRVALNTGLATDPHAWKSYASILLSGLRHPENPARRQKND